MSYHQLTSEQRYQIERLIALRKSRREIAELVGVHRSTIYREIKRNSLEVFDEPLPIYDAIPAIGLARGRRTEACANRFKVKGKVKTYVVKKLKSEWSPEQIAGRAKLKRHFELHPSSIYRFIDNDAQNLAGERLFTYLRRFKPSLRKRRKKRVCHGRRGAPKKSIRERPKASDQRSELGHFERDLMEGPRKKRRAVLVVIDRKSRYISLRFVEKTGVDVQRATKKILNQPALRAWAKTMTNDNGYEFIPSISKSAEAELGVPIYFADPCSPWQRGTVENGIGLLRQYLPKKTDLTEISGARLKRIEDRLNNRPRKILNYQTPSEIFLAQTTQKSA